MKTTTFKLWCVFAVLFLGLASCTPKADDPDPATLTVAPGELTFQNGEGSETVKITTNQESWVATSPQEGSWIELVPSGTNLTVKVKKNEISEPRTTYIIVNAGAATPQKVKVTQNPADIVLNLTPDAINVPMEGGTYTVDISSNNDLWNIELEPAEDWVTMTVHKTAKMAYITVKENTTTEERQAVLRATNKSKAIEVPIKQAAMPNMRYVMPYLKKKPKGYDIVSYEVARKSVLKRFSGAIPGWGIFEEDYLFMNRSELFTETKYTINVKTNSLVKITVQSTDYKTAMAERNQIIEFYKENGFEMTTQENLYIAGRHRTEPFDIKINYVKDQSVLIEFEQYADQDKPYKTFDQFPKFPEHYFGSPEWKFEQIKAEELKEGAKEGQHSLVNSGAHKGKVTLGLFEQAESKKPYILAGYFFNWENGTPADKLGTLDELVRLYSEVTLGFWEDTEVSGKFVITNEFKALLEKEGWKFLRIQNGFYIFSNSAKKFILATRAGFFTGFNDGNACLQMNFFPGEGEESENLKNFDKKVNAKSERWSYFK
ncbi:BACON domain-containing protein [Porphyromonas sp.]|uniref:BACON domain-containing protein n=1 Tax=Porphyromonas sp. TaxID=1924944 RepID=UPI0026DB4A8A|nr:BACON domain-containing protein [Porphyromonas sp.]MDO4771336.1 BACON domain-containing protein [Porphyromonas sp.]